MTEIIKKPNYLPDTIQELHAFILIGKEKLNAHKAKIRAIEKIDSAHAAKDAALSDTQDLADILLDAEGKLGEMLAGIEPKYSIGSSDGTNGLPKGASPRKKKTLPPGITKKESHFAQEIARHPEVVEEVKTKAREEGYIPTSQAVIKQIQKQKQENQKPQSLADIPKMKYQTIVIDPPWPTKKILRDVRPFQDISDYTPLTIEQITALPIQNIAEENCHLYLWTTHKYLPNALEIMDAWGFKYQCLLTWIKNVGITPFSWMYSTEHCLFGRKGNLDLLKKGLRLDFHGKVREHSRKPDEFYELVKKASPTKRIDFFSREKRQDFDQYGNEKDKF